MNRHGDTVMTSRQRMLNALAFRPVDILPLEISGSRGGLFEHGPKLADLMRQCGHDFGPLDAVAVPAVPPEDFDADGRYHKIATDAWGTTWEYRIFGVWGHRKVYPLADIGRLDGYRMPEWKPLEGDELARRQAEGKALRERYFHVAGGVSLFETMQNLRPYEDTLIDIMEDAPGINRLADRLVDQMAVYVSHAVAVGADALAVGDDFGMQQTPIFPVEVWRRFFRPRYERLLAPALQAGLKVLFHSCGVLGPVLDELRAIGASAVWPQLTVYDHRDLARRCRALGLAVKLHPDRGELMQRRTPGEVRDYVRRLVDEFDVLRGGAWLWIEIDPGFPWANVVALFETAMDLRGMRARTGEA